MRKRFVARKNRASSILKIALIGLVVILACFLTIKYLLKIKIADEKKINEYLAVSTNNMLGKISIIDLLNVNLTSPDTFLKLSFSGIRFSPKEVSNEVTTVNKEVEITEPILYIYNTHQTEDYDSGTLKEYNITPTVYMASVMLQKALEKKNINSIVEEENIKNLLTLNGWKYNQSYYASRLWLERTKQNHPSVKYYLDIHRDSVSGTTTINEVTYAKLMFVVGMNHDNYQANESLVIKLYNYINTNYEGVIKNIYYGKNSKYNQDFNENTVLVEVGGPNNTIDEVYNSINLLAEAYEYVIGESNG